MLIDDANVDRDTMFYSDLAWTLVSTISILAVLSYNEVMATIAPVQAALAFADILDIVNRAYANVVNLI